MNRSTLGSLILAITTGVTLAGCGQNANSQMDSPTIRAAQAKPTQIIPTPANTLFGAAPEPNGTMWIVAGPPASHGIFQLDLSQKKVVGSVSVSNHANTIAESSTGIVALGLSTSHTGAIEFLNGSSGALLNTVPVSGPVVSLAAGDDGITFYALNGNSTAKSIAIINAQTDKVETSVPAPNDAVSAVPTPNEDSLYVLEPNGIVSQIQTAGGHISTQFPVGHSGRALTIGPNGHTLYVLKGQGSVRNVAVVNLATESVTKVLPAPANTQNIVLSPNGQILYDVVGAPSIGNVQSFSVR
ncbi:YncE family protein [Sulfobacillus thermosulfidooxidans]|uniref:YncE family protein n=1 Tax=Sulfobacillus thermosulfidooxidans TaxID=28034 RepID=UPI00096B80B2|nr:hypothetical protein [Sulfobacillus thermosulfidooxidans]OLZ10230.1 hypothetical protein BFX05_10640 [Sulfobacillus thermosulfidooxidans]OLZ17022.1 hypothetical protein BFX06_13850 [Sulfobacillus thermosulfidooxidans]OLZ20118.1 hypothetical protein BFX07_00580 [Sulfobacillus thermosulfidooxidans]